mmetsp:Transcript_18116/g.63671  ORF Transcript_18116/g.63671 Transcript_18116/m.63671 type:complete len:278 (-) Transcript_18116:633-1466(-)
MVLARVVPIEPHNVRAHGSDEREVSAALARPNFVGRLRHEVVVVQSLRVLGGHGGIANALEHLLRQHFGLEDPLGLLGLLGLLVVAPLLALLVLVASSAVIMTEERRSRLRILSGGGGSAGCGSGSCGCRSGVSDGCGSRRGGTASCGCRSGVGDGCGCNSGGSPSRGNGSARRGCVWEQGVDIDVLRDFPGEALAPTMRLHLQRMHTSDEAVLPSLIRVVLYTRDIANLPFLVNDFVVLLVLLFFVLLLVRLVGETSRRCGCLCHRLRQRRCDRRR